MYHCKIQFYDKTLKLGHKGQRSRLYSDILDKSFSKLDSNVRIYQPYVDLLESQSKSNKRPVLVSSGVD